MIESDPRVAGAAERDRAIVAPCDDTAGDDREVTRLVPGLDSAQPAHAAADRLRHRAAAHRVNQDWELIKADRDMGRR